MRTMLAFLVSLVRELVFLFLGILGLFICLVGVDLSLTSETGFWTTQMVQFHLLGFDATSFMFWHDGLGMIVVGGFLILVVVMHFNLEIGPPAPRRPLPPIPPPRPIPPRR